MTRRPRDKAVLLLSTTAGIVVSGAIAGGRPILASRWSLLVELGAWACAWLLGVIAVFRIPGRRTLVWIFIAATALRLAALAGPPTTSDDLYRYAWDGRVQATGIDPYSAPPANPALVGLHEPWLWPNGAGCAALHRPPACTRINRPAERTIYPPAGEAWFAAVYRAGGISSHHKAWQIAGLITDLGTIALLTVALRRWQVDPRWVALYALCPAPILEVVNNGHVDGLAILLTVGALTIVQSPAHYVSRLSPRQRHLAAGALIGAAALVKVYPAVVLPALVGTRRESRAATLAGAGGTAAAVAVAGYLPHMARVGSKVIGYLPGYLAEEHYGTAGRYLIAGVLRLPPGLTGPASLVAVVAVAVWVLVRRPPVPTGAAALFGTLLLAASPVQPWYAAGLVALGALAVQPRWVTVMLAGYPYFFAVILGDRHATGVGQTTYSLALLLVGAATRFGRRARGRAELSCSAEHGKAWL